jgi:cell shape-determining protein MreC
MEENAGLLSQLENLRLDIADYESIKSENKQLRDDLKIKPIGNFITSSILAKSPQIPLDSLFIDRGTIDGINNGDVVLASEKVLIGKIAKVTKNRATVALNSFAGVITYGFVERTNEPLEIKGVGGGSMEAKAPIDFDIAVGDKIMMGGPFTFLAAVAGAVEEDKSSGFKNVLLSLPVDVSKINTVFVVPTINE